MVIKSNYKKNSRTNKKYLMNNSLFKTLFIKKNDKFNFKRLSILKHGVWNNYNNYSEKKNIKQEFRRMGRGNHTKPFEYNMHKCRRY